MKTGSSDQVIMYRLHISSWWVAPAYVGDARSVELKLQVASSTCPGQKLTPETGVKPWGSCGLFSTRRLWLSPWVISSRYTDLYAGEAWLEEAEEPEKVQVSTQGMFKQNAGLPATLNDHKSNWCPPSN